MKWPWSKKESTAGALFALWNAGQPVFMARNPKAFALEGYQQNVIAYRCVRLIAAAAADCSIFVMRGDEEVPNHPALTLLSRPNPINGGRAFFEAVYSYYLITGNSYIESISTMRGVPAELWVLPAHNVFPIAGKSGLPEGYEFRSGAQTKRWAVDFSKGETPILHFKAFNPLDIWHGQSPMEAASLSIDQHNASSRWNKALLDNSARPSGALIFEGNDGDGTLSDEQFAKLKEQIAAMYQGDSNAGRPLLLEGGLKWQAISMTHRDMDWLAGRQQAAQEVALAFGVPPELVGLASTFNNRAEANLELYEKTVVPLVRRLLGELNNWLMPKFDGATLEIDEDSISALEPRREARFNRAQQADFLTINEKREMMGFPAVDGGDQVLVQSTLLPVDFQADVGEDDQSTD